MFDHFVYDFMSEIAVFYDAQGRVRRISKDE